MLRLVARRQPPQDHGAVAGLDPLALPARYAARGASAGSHASLSPAPYASWLGSVGRKADVLQSSHDVSSLSDSAGPSVVRNALAAGWGHSLLAYSGAQDTQRAFALGRNEAAQLGIGFASHEPTRGVVEGFKGDEILQAAASCQCSYLLLGNGEDSTRLFAAGSRQRGRLGQIGGERAAHLDEDDASRQVALIASMSPITTPEHSGPIVEVATGFDHLLVRTSSGRLLGSGANSDGQLGLGGASVRDVETLTDVSPFGAHDDTVVTVRSGADTSFAIMRSGELWAWGNSEYAQACHGSIIDQVLEPQLVETRGWLPSGRQIVDVRCGGSFTVILDDCGSVYTVGFGALGLGHDRLEAVSPQRVDALEGHAISRVRAGWGYAFAVSDEGKAVHAWGLNNSHGRLGVGAAATGTRTRAVQTHVFSPRKLELPVHFLGLSGEDARWRVGEVEPGYDTLWVELQQLA